MTPPPALAAEARLVLSALQFLTRLPVPDPGWEAGRMRRASRYFGLVGLLVGTLAGLVWLAASALLPGPVAAGLALAAGLAVTGALHEDGLADCADALGARGDRARALEIMRDSRLGSYGAAALVLLLGLRWAALSGMSAGEGALALMLAATAGRALIVPATALAPYARETGLGAAMGPGAGPTEIGGALAAALLAGALAGAAGGLALAAAALVAFAVLLGLKRWLGGYTGDGLGAIAALSETAVLVALAGAWGQG
ncbi:adenosylcobinamide-GDP ribazoletransferase [Paralimibaculum aggregatum]|uniref:Adenosylcobinamide-GDP ribazoletransferase n=1 Tax=Paralimibaculum aggregatum TaxID=3036245 RepID=A0ABQ6LIQ4_9RHOB|nr:adenosylcobinamide-GDP ribazoletransferase [Limibaculum sp. NKW23]GMG81058.1 adenosylcobinamide-GDP ribazoletransferase [Limibaculum sp. NKW23]